jgi:rhodanese-related sulfurtransferase
MWIKTIKEAISVMLIALTLAGVGYALRPGLMQPKTGSDAAEDDSAITAISLAEARTHFEKKDALFADARPMRAYSEGHIKGAVNLDPNEFDTWSGDFFSRISPDQMIIVYCEGAQCRLSLELAEKLAWMGYENVHYLKNGWGLWKENQLPSEYHPD